MAAVLPSLHVESPDSKLSKYFLGYQLAWIKDESRMRFAEKSVRVGFTYCDAFKNVRKRILNKDRDYLFATKDQPSAIEYLKTCEDFARIFNFARQIVSRGEDSVRVQSKRDTGETFTEEVKFGYIKFDTGSRIIAFSSNPYAMAVFGGDVGLDEFAKHPNAEKLWETAQGRITWGYDLGMWSAHDGTDTLFYQFAQEARAGKGGWSYYRITMADAIDAGLVEKINETRGTKMTREEFLQDCKNRARLPEVYEQAYNCNPQGSTSAIVPWASIERCRRDYQIPRVHLEAAQIAGQFGVFRKAEQIARQGRIQRYLQNKFATLLDVPAAHRLGFDVAASGEGDLASIYIDRKDAGALHLAALFTCRTDDWDFLKTALWMFHAMLPALLSTGDETGLGRQICWETEQQFPGIFTAVNFASDKHDMGFALMNQLEVAEKIFPHSEADVAQDYFAMRKIHSGGRWKFTEGRNLLNPASHCDIAWAGALSSHADTMTGVPSEAEGVAAQRSGAGRIIGERRNVGGML